MLNSSDYLLAVAAYTYEIGQPIMSDSSFDIQAGWAAERNTELPGFSDVTGMWVNNMDKQVLHEVWQIAASVWPGKWDLHHPQIEYALDKLGVPYDRGEE